jgi:hypothetical protein
MAYFRALAALCFLSTSSFGCTLARGVTASPGHDDASLRDGGLDASGHDGGDSSAPDTGTMDANIDAAGAPDTGIDAAVPDVGIDAFTPDAFTPDAFTPDAFTPDAFTPDAFTPDAFTPDAFTPECAPGETRCSTPGVLQSCTAGLLWGSDVTCTIACTGAPAPAHCAVFQPSNVAPTAAGTPAALSISGTTVIDTTACTATGVGGLAIEPQLTGGRDACVLRVASLAVTGTGVLYALGTRPLVVVSSGDVTIDGRVDVSSFQTDPSFSTFVRGAGSNTGGTAGMNGGNTGFADGGGGGGGFCGAGGNGGTGVYNPFIGTTDMGAGGTGGGGIGTSTLEPLVGGADGGNGGSNADSVGPGGGAIQISSFTRIVLSATALVVAAGGGGDSGIEAGNATNAGGGGGSGGALLLEAPTVTVTAGARFEAGGGGGASGGCVGASDGRDGGDAAESFVTGTLRAPGGAHQCGATATGGQGAGDASATGGNGVGGGISNASGGGGGAGCVFFRTSSGTTPTGVVTNPTTIVGAGTVHSL